MKKFLCHLLLTLLVCLPAGIAGAHGAGYHRLESEAVALEFFYSTGEVMGLEEAKVYSPSGGDNPFQLGQTDVHGRFSFVPDAPGLWRVVVKDGLGHVAEAAVEIDDAFISGAAGAKVAHSGPTAISGIQKLSLALTGLALIITLAALVLTLRRLKRRG